MKLPLFLFVGHLATSHAILCGLFGIGCPPPVDVCETVQDECAPPPQLTESQICDAVVSTECPGGPTVDVCGTIDTECPPPPQPTEAEICASVGSTCPPPEQPTDAEICSAVAGSCPVDVCQTVNDDCPPPPPPAPPTLSCERMSRNLGVDANINPAFLDVSPDTPFSPCPSGSFVSSCGCVPFLQNAIQFKALYPVMVNNGCQCLHGNDDDAALLIFVMCCSVS